VRIDAITMSDETVLLTGCSSGIGHATAELFAREDWVVYATSRDENDLGDLAELGCRTAALDVTDATAIERVVDRVIDEQGRLDCLVNNAGYAQYGPLEDVPADELHRQFEVNVYGPHRLSRAVLPHMREAGDGTIVNVSSVQGRIATPGAGAYSGSKFALEAMSDALRGEVDGLGVDVVLVEPGPVATNFTERSRDELEAGLDRREAAYGWLYEAIEDTSILMGSAPFAAEPREVAAVVHEAAESTNPRARYPVGRAARYLLLSRFLPDALRDLGFRFVSRLA
jgi:NAD(P)-dependent dehydrogenase (short-subunit alcohol dehydrogenase family)